MAVAVNADRILMGGALSRLKAGGVDVVYHHLPASSCSSFRLANVSEIKW
jgi:hypothetical protein